MRVLRFEEKDGQLTVSAIDAIKIDNQYLGYRISYYLTRFVLYDDKASEYLGRAHFVPYDGKEYKRKRDKLYRSSPKHFFKNLIDDNLAASGYEISMSQQLGDKFVTLQTPPIDQLIKPLPGGQYKFFFPAFLRVTDSKIRSVSNKSIAVRAGGQESAKFSGTVPQESLRLESMSSLISKDAPYVLLNKYGNVLNSKKVKEYGYWATQRMAHQLPFEYGNDLNYEEEGSEDFVSSELVPLELLKSLIYEKEQKIKEQTLGLIAKNWDAAFAPPLIELLRLSTDKWLVESIQKLLVDKTTSVNDNYYEWLQWLWGQPPMYDTYYADFKALLYKHIDPQFESYFRDRQFWSEIRVDEIVWGGVVQDGIPPLRSPKMIAADEATYLSDNDIVFGLVVNGEARAYPKRILAWHEMFVDKVGSVNLAGVYCTLCGTVIPYQVDDYDLGTSGFLYRSNKLMYDKATHSLWSTIDGKPVMGPLVESEISLLTHPVVTCSWREWKTRHPETKVLDINTDHDRDYTEGKAYENYFGNDNLMFPVPHSDDRLSNKAEVFIIRTEAYEKDPLAISISYLKKKNLYQDKIADTNFVVVASDSGASRAYASGEVTFVGYKKDQLIDAQGQFWTVTEEALVSSVDSDNKLPRLPAHNVFWFAWVNQYSDTRLVK